MWYVNGNKMDTLLPATSKKLIENYVNRLQGSIWSETDFTLRLHSLVQQGRVYHFAGHILATAYSCLPLTVIYIYIYIYIYTHTHTHTHTHMNLDLRST